MKSIAMFSLLLSITFSAAAQQNSFPQSWVGHWKGELQWFKSGKAEPQTVKMELRIQPTDSAGTYTWQLIYGTISDDNRPYLLVPRDIPAGHWVIDERNGIVLDQFWIGDKLCGAFTVQNSTILNNYRMENGKLMVEFFSLAAKPLVTTGNGTEESPKVDSYRMSAYQKAVLTKSN